MCVPDTSDVERGCATMRRLGICVCCIIDALNDNDDTNTIGNDYNDIDDRGAYQ